MRTFRILGTLLLTAAISLSFTACSGDDEPEEVREPLPYLVLSQQELHLDNQAHDITMTVTTNQEKLYPEMFEVTSDRILIDCNWIELTAQTRADIAPMTLTFHISANDRPSEREGMVTLWARAPYSQGAEHQIALIIHQAGTKTE